MVTHLSKFKFKFFLNAVKLVFLLIIYLVLFEKFLSINSINSEISLIILSLTTWLSNHKLE